MYRTTALTLFLSQLMCGSPLHPSNVPEGLHRKANWIKFRNFVVHRDQRPSLLPIGKSIHAPSMCTAGTCSPRLGPTPSEVYIHLPQMMGTIVSKKSDMFTCTPTACDIPVPTIIQGVFCKMCKFRIIDIACWPTKGEVNRAVLYT